MKKLDESTILEALEILRKQGKAPDCMWHPDFGYVIIDGEPTENTEAFLELLKEKKLI